MMKTVSFSFVAKFPAKKVVDCFTNPAFAKTHTASKLFSKAGIYKTDKKLIVRSLVIDGAAKDAIPVVAVITFADAEAGKAAAVSATFVNVPDAKAAEIKGLGKTINADIAKFLAPKAIKVSVKAAKKAPAKKTAKKPAAAKKAPAKKTVAAQAVKKPVAKRPAGKKTAMKKPAASAKQPMPAPVAPAAETK